MDIKFKYSNKKPTTLDNGVISTELFEVEIDGVMVPAIIVKQEYGYIHYGLQLNIEHKNDGVFYEMQEGSFSENLNVAMMASSMALERYAGLLKTS